MINMLTTQDYEFLKAFKVSIPSSNLGAILPAPPSFPHAYDMRHVDYLTAINKGQGKMLQEANRTTARLDYYRATWKALALAGWVMFGLTALGWISRFGR